MRVVVLTAAASALSLGLAGCVPHVDYASRTTLDCPDRQGALERTGIAADRKSCTYRGRDGAEVTLKLTPVSGGDAMAALSAIETSLVGPAAAKPASASAETTPTPPTPPKPPASPADVDRAAAEAERDAHAASDGADWDTGGHHRVTIEHDGKHVVVGGDEDAHVNLPGLHIDADGDNAKVDIGGIHVDANEDQATVRVFRSVRLRGQAFSRERNGLRATFIAKRDDLPDGYRFVGYEASGPKQGPLTVAIVKSRDEIGHGGHMLRDLERLVRRNGGA